jgi:hypothetical protein
MRTQVWLCIPNTSLPARSDSVFATAKSRPKVVMTVFFKVRLMPEIARARRTCEIAA